MLKLLQILWLQVRIQSQYPLQEFQRIPFTKTVKLVGSLDFKNSTKFCHGDAEGCWDRETEEEAEAGACGSDIGNSRRTRRENGMKSKSGREP